MSWCNEQYRYLKLAGNGLAELAKVALIIEYDGTEYHGFQIQPNLPTIQAAMERAMLALTGEKVRARAASRTDSGVHARGQVVEFANGLNMPMETVVRALNHYLPADIAVRAAYPVADDFDARRYAVSRNYRYHILNRKTRSPLWRRWSHTVASTLDVQAMNLACQALVGIHDFAAFTWPVAGKSTVRRVFRAEVARKGDLVTIDIEANSFLAHQIRNTAGALIRVGLGQLEAAAFHRLVASAEAGAAWPAAPACGLCLMEVKYTSPWTA
ncbi:MAG: tRNA pseudouridine(38-40) synthase TruA [Chloroflexi bacterium]|nr:tRNA pseudouridine(38-40) synthase TruA [Chloroflexota bacterium]